MLKLLLPTTLEGLPAGEAYFFDLLFLLCGFILLMYGDFTVQNNKEFMMIKMSRAGRKAMMFKAMMAHDRKHPDGCLTTSQLAKGAGLKSGTNVVRMLKEMEDFNRVVEVEIEPKYGCGYTVRAWKLAKVEQMELPEGTIVINGVSWMRESVGLS